MALEQKNRELVATMAKVSSAAPGVLAVLTGKEEEGAGNEFDSGMGSPSSASEDAGDGGDDEVDALGWDIKGGVRSNKKPARLSAGGWVRSGID